MPDVRSGRRASPPRAVFLAAALLLALTACQTTVVDPAAETMEHADVELASSSFKPDESLRVRFLPPVGSGKPKGDFVDSLHVEVAVFSLDCVAGHEPCAPLGPRLDTLSLGGIDRDGETYTLLWPVLDPEVAERVRLEIRMVGSGDEPACDEYGGECLGFLDVRIVEKGGKGHGGGSSKGLVTVPSGGSYEVRFKVLAPTSVQDLAELSGQGGLDVENGSCPANEVSLPSQGLQAVGAGLQAVGAGLQAVGAGLQAVGAGSGGVFVVKEAGGGDLGPVSAFAAALPFFHLGFPKRDVLLIVLDDFGGGPGRQPAFFLPPALAFHDLRDLTYAELSDLAAAGEYSHGALVLYETVELIEKVRGFGVLGFEHELGGAPFFEFGGYPWGPTVRVQAVNARNADGVFDTDTAAAALADALAAAKHRGYHHVVVNMSFSIVPCGVLDDFARVAADPSGSPAGLDEEQLEDGFTFEDYVAALMEYNSVSGAMQTHLQQAVHEPVDVADDALLGAIACPPTGGTSCGQGLTSLVFVAASGNYGLDFPLFPAALQGVVSVGAQGVDDSGDLLPSPAAFSNLSAVLAPGDVVVVRTQGRYGLALKGTSFAAPVVSAFTALDLQALHPVCSPADPASPTVDGSRAELAVGGFDPLTGAFGDLPELPLLLAYSAGGPSAVRELCLY